MKRILLSLSVLLLVLALMDGWLRSRQQAQLVATATLRPLVAAQSQVVPERVGRLTLRFQEGQGFSYVRDGTGWRFPAYHHAYAHADRVERLLQVSLGSLGTLFTTDPDAHGTAGLERPTLHIGLFDRRDQALASLEFAGPLPGPGGPETYARIAGSDTVLHLHGDPISLIGHGRPPMLDPHLLPRSLQRSAWVSVEVAKHDEPSWRLERVLAPVATQAPPVPLDAAQRYMWLMHRGARIDTSQTRSVMAFLGYLQQVRIDGLTENRPMAEADPAIRVRLVDEDGLIEHLVVRTGSEPASGVTVYNERAGITGRLSTVRATWLTPPAQVLLDSLQQPSPFDRALQTTSGATP